MQVEGAVALVTGGGRRLGQAIAVALGESGARVAVHYSRSQVGAADTAATIRAAGGEAIILQADLTSAQQAVRLVESASDHMGPVEVLINNASIFQKRTLPETTAEDWDRHFAVHVRAPFLLAQAMRSGLPAGRKGKIVSMNDWNTARPERFAYGASKAALSGLTRSLALALAPDIEVSEVALGAILPPSDMTDLKPEKGVLGPAGRMGSVDEVAGAVLALIRNDYISGVTLHVDGGRHLR